MKTFPKQPSERLAYDVDLTDWFQAAAPLDFLVDAQATVTAASDSDLAGLTVSMNQTLIGTPPTIAKVWIEGGANGTDYKVTLIAETSEQRIKEVDFGIRVRER